MTKAEPLPVVEINGSFVTGTTHRTSPNYPRPVDVFHSIPFASVSRRFCRAAPLEPRTQDASRPGKPQPTFMDPDEEAERELTLHVIRPSSRQKSQLLPVVVYIHGGGFNFGEPLERNLEAFVSHAQEDVVVVAVAYRLGVLGFLAGGDEDGGNEELNLGLRDQRVAVGWVRRWIGEFGGDSEDITLMGVSAGAHSIGHHILHPDKLPFSKAILESGSSTARSVLSSHHPRTKAQYKALKSETSSQTKSLQDMPINVLLDAATQVWADNAEAVTWPFQPVVDTSSPDSLIPCTPLKLWNNYTSPSSSPKSISIITGFCSHEGTSFVPSTASTNAEFRAFFTTLIPNITPGDLDALEALYPDPVTNPDSPWRNQPSEQQSYGAQFRRLHTAYADYAYICPILHTAHTLSALKKQATGAQVHVYVYEFAALGNAFHAASHGEQAPVVAHDMDFLEGKPGLIATAGEMNSRWTAFGASKEGTLRPDVWPEFETPFSSSDDGGGGGAGAGKMLIFGEGNDEQVEGGERRAGVPVKERTLTDSEMERCKFWWERMGLSQGMSERDAAGSDISRPKTTSRF